MNNFKGHWHEGSWLSAERPTPLPRGQGRGRGWQSDIALGGQESLEPTLLLLFLLFTKVRFISRQANQQSRYYRWSGGY